MLTKAVLLDPGFDSEATTDLCLLTPLSSGFRAKSLIDDDEYSFIPNSLERWRDRKFAEGENGPVIMDRRQ